MIIGGSGNNMIIGTKGKGQGWAMDFDGTSDYVEVPDDDNFNIDNSDLSVEFWFKSFNLGGAGFVSKKENDSLPGWVIWTRAVEPHTVKWRGDDGTLKDFDLGWTGADYEDGKWHQVVVVYSESDTSIKAYLDNSLTAESLNYSLEDAANTRALTIGFAETWPQYLNGQIDDVRIYNRALSETEVTDLYYKKDITNGLVGHWKFNEGSGSTAYDSSGNGNHGTIYGATWKQYPSIKLQ
jgi:hypothetical protein